MSVAITKINVLLNLGGVMDKFNSKIALALLSTLVSAHGGASAMNSNTNKSISGPLASESDVLRGPAKQENILKKLWPLWGVLGVGVASFIAFGIIKALKPGDKGTPDDKTKGTVYYGLGNFKSADELKNNWENVFGGFNESELLKKFLIDLSNKYTAELKKEDDKKVVTELIKSSAKIYFNNDNFDCYDTFDKKLNLTDYERDIISSIAKLFREKLGIVPCAVSRFPHCFYFSFNTNEGAGTEILNTHVSGIGNGNLLCDFRLFN